MLYRQLQKKLSLEERITIYSKWRIALNTKQRSLQLAQLVWTKTDMPHVRESASLVAKLIGFQEQGEALKEMFGLSFIPQQTNHRSFSFTYRKSLLMWGIRSYSSQGSKSAELPIMIWHQLIHISFFLFSPVCVFLWFFNYQFSIEFLTNLLHLPGWWKELLFLHATHVSFTRLLPVLACSFTFLFPCACSILHIFSYSRWFYADSSCIILVA